MRCVSLPKKPRLCRSEKSNGAFDQRMGREVGNAVEASQDARGNVRAKQRIACAGGAALQVEERYACQAVTGGVVLHQRADGGDACGCRQAAEQLAKFQKCVHDFSSLIVRAAGRVLASGLKKAITMQSPGALTSRGMRRDVPATAIKARGSENRYGSRLLLVEELIIPCAWHGLFRLRL
jgi:hypothetical protein